MSEAPVPAASDAVAASPGGADPETVEVSSPGSTPSTVTSAASTSLDDAGSSGGAPTDDGPLPLAEGTETRAGEPPGPGAPEAAPTPTPSLTPSLRAARLRVFVGALCGLVLLGSVFGAALLQERNMRSVPVEDWQAAAERVRAQYQAGDVVRIEPRWADDPRVFLPGARFDLSAEPMREILDGFARVWVLAGFNRGAEVHERMPDAYALAVSESFGSVDLLRYDLVPELRTRFDFVDAIRNAKVQRVFPNRTQACSNWVDESWNCTAKDQFLYVGARLREMGDDPRRCIFAPPIPDDGWVEIRYEDVVLGARIEGRVGMDNWAIRSDRGSATDFELVIDGERLVSKSIDKHDGTFHPFAADTSARAGATAEVVFRVHASDFFDRFLCFSARIPAP